MERIAEGGGLVGLTTYPAHVVTNTPSFGNFIQHIDHVVRLVGDQYVCLAKNIIVHDLENATRFFTNSKIEFTELGLPGYEDVTCTWNVTQALVERGYTDDSIRRIMVATSSGSSGR